MKSVILISFLDIKKESHDNHKLEKKKNWPNNSIFFRWKKNISLVAVFVNERVKHCSSVTELA